MTTIDEAVKAQTTPETDVDASLPTGPDASATADPGEEEDDAEEEDEEIDEEDAE